tara:strand:+ start:357 stop:503 length:147 start_codon:yes stop_codon:yes gene_type:complete
MIDNWYEEATWTCPICDYTLYGNEPAVHVVCDNCKKDEKAAMEERSTL